jgi:hypothetical protein
LLTIYNIFKHSIFADELMNKEDSILGEEDDFERYAFNFLFNTLMIYMKNIILISSKKFLVTYLFFAKWFKSGRQS